jgi:non-heme chloroperoxidase
VKQEKKYMPFFETNDHTSLYYRDWGTGASVVFVSSVVLSGAMWEYQMLPLSELGLRCIAYDRRGHGRSDNPGRGYEFDTLADDLAALIEQPARWSASERDRAKGVPPSATAFI